MTTACVRSHVFILICWLLVSGQAVVAGFSAQGSGVAPTLVVRGGQYFDSNSGTLKTLGAIVISGDRIQRVVAPDEDFSAPRDARVVDAAGKFVLPGLIDGHAHVGHVQEVAGVKAEETLPLYLAAGVTALRDVGDTVEVQSRVGEFIAQHPERAPLLFRGSPLFDKAPPYHVPISIPITEPSQVAPFVERLAAADVRTFKIYVGMDRAIGSEIIREAHRHGRRVTAHLRKYAPLDAIEDGIDSIEHIESVFDFVTPPEVPYWPLRDERTHMAAMAVASLRRRILEEQVKTDFSSARARELIAALAKHRVAVDPTLVVYRNWMLLSDDPAVRSHPDLKYLPARLTRYWNSTAAGAGASPDTFELRQRQFAKLQELTGELHRAGVELLAGTDSPVHFIPPGFSLHHELQLLVESGLSPAAALTAATRNNARALDRAADLGSIENGKIANLVLLDADPLNDIRNTRRIALVIRSGIVCEPDALLRLVPTE